MELTRKLGGSVTSSFLTNFSGMWRRPVGDYDRAVSEYLVVLDANVLLQLYRFTPDARNELINVLRKIDDRLWIPHQVAKEYYDRRVDAIKEHLDLYASVPKALGEARAKAIQEINTFARRCSISGKDRDGLTRPIESAFDAVMKDIEQRKEVFDLNLAKVVTGDPVLEDLARIFDGKTGDPFDSEDVEKFAEEFKKRVEGAVPPGFEDARKAENAHGDYFVWEQLLQEAAKRNVPVLFVTNDEKKDWVRKQAGITVGPRPELIAEFGKRCGTDFLLANLGLFLSVAKRKLGIAVSESTVAQAESVERRGKRRVEEYVVSHKDYLRIQSRIASELQRLARAVREGGASSKERSSIRARSEYLADLLELITDPDSLLDLGGSVLIEMDSQRWEYVQELLGGGAEESFKGTIDDSRETSLLSVDEVRDHLIHLEGEFRRTLNARMQAERILVQVEGTAEQSEADRELQIITRHAANIRSQIAAAEEFLARNSDFKITDRIRVPRSDGSFASWTGRAPSPEKERGDFDG
ncbi:PIN domain-containing protein [Streptomyces litmocidini]|uniref:PIN domain-containing protein n=1 Tax=Streptomyces litmocidini TaxID=67318 RepID=A0ABW7U3R8_9ACTN